MGKRRNRVFRVGCAHHLYLKAQDGNVLFYRTEDYVFYLTLFFVLAKRYGIEIEAFCIMFNHIHAFVKPTEASVFRAFVKELQRVFSVEYGKEYGYSGSIFMPCGYAPKSSRKSILSCLLYIWNNPVAGKLTARAVEYKWNLLAYTDCDCPFSEKLLKREAGSRMRKALRMVDYFCGHGQYLDYTRQQRIYHGLDGMEKKQIVDYIICRYNPVDKEAVTRRFGSFRTALTAMDSNTGAEHDLTESWEDYSVYTRMLRTVARSGTDYYRFRFGKKSGDGNAVLCRLLSAIPGMTPRHLQRFLHLAPLRERDS